MVEIALSAELVSASITPDGTVYGKLGKPLATSDDGGRLQVHIRTKKSKDKFKFPLAKLVLWTFAPHPEDASFSPTDSNVTHANGDFSDCSIGNRSWGEHRFDWSYLADVRPSPGDLAEDGYFISDSGSVFSRWGVWGGGGTAGPCPRTPKGLDRSRNGLLFLIIIRAWFETQLCLLKPRNICF